MYEIDKKYGNLNRKTYIDSNFEHLLASNFTESLFLKCSNIYKIFKKSLLRPHMPVRAQYRARCKFLIGVFSKPAKLQNSRYFLNTPRICYIKVLSKCRTMRGTVTLQEALYNCSLTVA